MSSEEGEREAPKSGAAIEVAAGTVAAGAQLAASSVFGIDGAIAGALAGPVVVAGLAEVGREVRRRFLSPKEDKRIVTALDIAVRRIEDRVEDGEVPRSDGLVMPGQDPRGMLEGSLLEAAKSNDERKVRHIGAFYASFVFEERVSADEADFLLSLWDRLTFHQFVLLVFFDEPDFKKAREQIRDELAKDQSGITERAAAELAALANAGLMGVEFAEGEIGEFGGSGMQNLGAADLTDRLARLTPTKLGETLIRMAELRDIPDDEKQEIATFLRGSAA